MEHGSLLVTVSATGTIEPEEVVDVGAQVPGVIQAFGPDPRTPGKTIDFGSPVETGALLARLDPAVYQGRVDLARADLQRAKAEFKQAMAQARKAELEWQRVQKAPAATPLDVAIQRAAYDVAQAGAAVAQAGVQQARAKLRNAERDLGLTNIRAPITGVIVDRRVNLSQTVVSNLSAPSLFLIAKDLKKLQVWASVPEADIGQIKPGQRVTFDVDAFPGRAFQGVVAADQPRLNAGLTRNVVNYTVVVQTDNADRKLLPYLTAECRFEVARREKALLVPNQALRWQPRPEQVAPDSRSVLAKTGHPRPTAGRGVVWVEQKGYVRPVEVQTGLTDGTRTEIIKADLAEGAAVVIGVTEAKPDGQRREGRTSPWGWFFPAFRPNLSTDKMLIQAGVAGIGGVSFGIGPSAPLTVEDAAAIVRECPAVRSAAPVVRVRTQVAFRSRIWVPMYVYGTTPDYLDVQEWADLAEGEAFTAADVRQSRPVCLLGRSVARTLFPDQSPSGRRFPSATSASG